MFGGRKGVSSFAPSRHPPLDLDGELAFAIGSVLAAAVRTGTRGGASGSDGRRTAVVDELGDVCGSEMTARQEQGVVSVFLLGNKVNAIVSKGKKEEQDSRKGTSD
jgi:hypothetical protein